MLRLRRREDRGKTERAWLSSRHAFSFGDYINPRFMGFRALKVINEDLVAPGGGFAEHPHRDMEIFSFVLKGAMEHRDSLGNGSVIRPGEVQRMSAGTGVRHSEFNHLPDEELHFLQVWIQPGEEGVEPSYEQASFDATGRMVTLAAPDRRDGSLMVHQDVVIYRGQLEQRDEARLALDEGRHAWVQVTSGVVEVNGQRLRPGDGIALTEVADVRLLGGDGGSSFLLFDLA